MPSANEWILSHRALVAALQLDATEIVKPDGLCDGPTTQRGCLKRRKMNHKGTRSTTQRSAKGLRIKLYSFVILRVIL